MSNALASNTLTRLAALALSVAAVAMAAMLLVTARGWYQARSERLFELVDLQARFGSAAAEAGAEKANDVDDIRSAGKIAFLQGGDDAVTAADLQSRLRAMVTGKGCEFSSVRVLPTKNTGGHAMLGLRVQMRGPMKGVRDVLHLVETAKPFLFVDRAVLRLEEQRGAVRDANEDAISSMYAELDIFGARWPDGVPVSADRSRK